jgi:diguanylate cyclase (GGDEF)-like protein/PAS domain S-box-containing protein
MHASIEKTAEESRRLWRWSWVALGLGVLLSLVLWQRAAQQSRDREHAQFQQDVTDVTQQLDRLIDHHLDLLGSFQAMFRVSDQVSRRAFHAHFLTLDAHKEYPGLLAVHFSRWVPAADKAAFVASVRNDRSLTPAGYPGYDIQPSGDRPAYVPIQLVEPLQADVDPGYDTLVDPLRRDSIERARDTARPQATAPLTLRMGEGADKWGFVVRLPVYSTQAQPTDVATRRQAYIGQISGVFLASALMRQALPSKRWADMQWRIEDLGPASAHANGALGAQPTKATQGTVVFDSATWGGLKLLGLAQHPQEQLIQPLEVAGRQWRLQFVRPLSNPAMQPFPLALLVGGVIASLGLWWALLSAASSHGTAVAMARSLSRRAVESEHRLRSVIDHTVDGILTLSPEGWVLGVNRAICSVFGYSEADLLRMHLGQLIPAAAASAANSAAGAEGHFSAQASIEAFLLTQRVGLDGLGRRTEGRRAGGELFPMDLAVSTMEEDGHKRYICVLRDLSTERAAEQAVIEVKRQLGEVDEMRRVIVHNAPYAIVVLNSHGVVQAINPAGEALLGSKASELIGRATTERFFDPLQLIERAHLLALRLNQPAQELNVLAHLAKDSPAVPSEWNLIRADGRSLVADISVTELTDEAGHDTGYLVMAQDVTSRHDAEHQLQHMALHDALTALPNRNMLQDQLKACVQMAERDGHIMAMMFIDLDRFKKINDTLGHHIGDTVLIEVARRLRSAMRTSDIVARLGGDEFVVLLPRIAEMADGERVAQKVIAELAEPLRVGPHELRVTPSIGLALYPAHGSDAITLMRHADLAMYRAKNNGRNRVQVYSDDMESPTADTLVLENDLYKAIERDELRLHFQPQFDCATGQVTGAEALLRWEHAGILVPPSDFIPLAEESGLIVQMGEWVLRRACTMAQQWRQQSGWPLRVAVNLSAVQLDQPDIADCVARVLQDTGLPPTALELEITESVVVRESLRAAAILSQLRALGVGIAIDDFGVGYSSFAYLRELPVDRLKLDRSFLSAVPQSPGDSRLTAALIAMAHRLEVGIVAEGVENVAQADFLRDHGCDEAQGYHLARPMDEAAFEVFLMAHSVKLSPMMKPPVQAELV